MDKDYAASAIPGAKYLRMEETKFAKYDAIARREFFHSLATVKPKIPEGIQHEVHSAPATDGFRVPVLRFKAVGSSNDARPAVLYIHGGGFICMSAELNAENICQYVLETGVQFFSVDYRLAPEHPYPTPLEDCWAALTWIFDQAQMLGVDTTRVAVMGESAGGGLAAGLAILARDRHLEPPLARQILGSPMLDDRNKQKIEPGVITMWNEDDNATGWAAYLGALDDIPIYASPIRATDVIGLPPLYVDVGQLDLFAQENHAYVGKFLAAGIEVEFHVYPGLPHGFEGFAPNHKILKVQRKNRNIQLKKLYN